MADMTVNPDAVPLEDGVEVECPQEIQRGDSRR